MKVLRNTGPNGGVYIYLFDAEAGSMADILDTAANGGNLDEDEMACLQLVADGLAATVKERTLELAREVVQEWLESAASSCPSTLLEVAATVAPDAMRQGMGS